MIFFLLKKSFFDAWDNLGTLALSNLAIFVILAGGLWPTLRLVEASVESGSASLALLILLPTVLLVSIAIAVISRIQRSVSDYRIAAWSDLRLAIASGWKDGLFLGGIAIVYVFLVTVGFSFYTELNTMIGFVAAVLLFWFTIGFILTFSWFLAVSDRLPGPLKVRLKKSTLIMLDNLPLSLFLSFIVIPFHIILWPIMAFAGFGPAGIVLFYQNALRLLLLKYDWLEEQGEQTGRRKRVPWDALLVDERERVGKRTFKGMIFPWKE